MSEVLYDHDSYDMNRWVSSKYMTISTAADITQAELRASGPIVCVGV